MLINSNIGNKSTGTLLKHYSKSIMSTILAMSLAVGFTHNVMAADNNNNAPNIENTSLPLSNETLRVAFSVAPPFVVVRGKFSDLSGIEVDLVRELQKRTGFKLVNNSFDIMNFSEMVEMAEKGEIDIIAGGIYANKERHKIYDFAGPTYQTCVTLVTHSNSPIDDFKDLDGKKVAAENGTVAGDLIPPEANVDVKMIFTPTNFMALYNVSRGIADAVIVDEPLAQEYIDNWPNSDLKIKMRIPGSDADMALLLKKNTEATRILQNTYQEMLKDGTVAKIVRNYNKNVDVSGLFGKQPLVI